MEEKNCSLNKVEKEIFNYLLYAGKTSIRNAADITGLVKIQAKRNLERLRKRGFLEKVIINGSEIFFQFSSTLRCIVSDERLGKDKVYIFSPLNRKSTILALGRKDSPACRKSMLLERTNALTADKTVAACITVKSVFEKSDERDDRFYTAFSPLDLLASYIGKVTTFEKCGIAYFDENEKAFCLVKDGKTESVADLSFLSSECKDEDEFKRKASEICIRLFSPDIFLLASYGADRSEGAGIKDALAGKCSTVTEIMVKDLTDAEIMRLAFEKCLGII